MSKYNCLGPQNSLRPRLIWLKVGDTWIMKRSSAREMYCDGCKAKHQRKGCLFYVERAEE